MFDIYAHLLYKLWSYHDFSYKNTALKLVSNFIASLIISINSESFISRARAASIIGVFPNLFCWFESQIG